MGNCDPYSDSPEPSVVDNQSLLGSRSRHCLCNHLKYQRTYQACRITSDLHVTRLESCYWTMLEGAAALFNAGCADSSARNKT